MLLQLTAYHGTETLTSILSTGWAECEEYFERVQENEARYLARGFQDLHARTGGRSRRCLMEELFCLAWFVDHVATHGGAYCIAGVGIPDLFLGTSTYDGVPTAFLPVTIEFITSVA